MKACTSSSFGVPYGSLRAGIETFAVYHQSAGRGVGGSSEISRRSLARVLGNRVWLGLHRSASDSCSHRRETFNFPFRGMAEEFSDSSWCVCVYGKTRLLLRKLSRSLLPGNANLGTFIPAAKLVCIADTGLVLSLSRSVTSGEAKSTRPLYTLE